MVPVVLDLNTHLRKWSQDARFCKPLVAALQSSLKRRFKGIFIKCEMSQDPGEDGVHQEPFFENLFFVAPVLDPQYLLHWVDEDVFTEYNLEGTRARVKDTLKGELVQSGTGSVIPF